MPFRPYHRFPNRTKLDRIVRDLRASGHATSTLSEDFYRYHPAMIHKLRSAKYNLDRLKERLTTTNTQDAADTTGEFMFEVNMSIDGFFYNAGSALDILARVVLTVFGQPLTGRIYFETAHTRLAQSRPGDPILARLKSPAWRQQFSEYRNTLTHELILASRYHIDIDNTGPEPIHQIVFPLPDRPRARPADRSFRQYPNVLDYAAKHFRRILTVANTVYGNIACRLEANGSLPL